MLAEHRLDQAEKTLEVAKESSKNFIKMSLTQKKEEDDDEDETQLDEKEQMKEYFKKSAIYQKFVQEQETEAKNKEECEKVTADLSKMKENYASLEQDVRQLELEI